MEAELRTEEQQKGVKVQTVTYTQNIPQKTRGLMYTELQ